MFNGVYELLACNSRIVALSSRRSNHVHIIDIKSQTITQSIQFPHTVQCIDVSAEDKLVVGFGKQLRIIDLLSGKFETFNLKGNCGSVAF